MPLLLNRDQVSSLLSMKECIDAVAGAFAELAEGRAVLPLRTTVDAGEGLSLYMPALYQQATAAAVMGGRLPGWPTR